MYYFTAEQFAQITAAAENSTSGYPYADRYAKIYEIIQEPDAFGNSAPSNVVAWFGAAAQANRGVGGASDFIRDYTQIQLEIRTGGTVSGIESVLQNASNAIAVKVFEDISENTQTIGGQTFYALPTAHEIGVNDATKAMAQLSAFDSDPGIWSGNPLFLGLGDASFWNENIVNTNNPGHTYDLFAALAAFKSAGLSTFLNGGTADLLNLFWSQGQEGRSVAANTVSNAYSEGNAFLTNAYGGYIGSGIAQFLVRDVVVGSNNADAGLEEESLLTYNTFMHAGAGNDLLIGSLGNDLLDGGAGDDDHASFEALSAGTSLQFEVTLDKIGSNAQFSAEVSAENVQSGLFNIEELHLGVNNDTLTIRELSGITTALNTINALSEETDGGLHGDTINLAQAVFSGATVSLAAETISMNDTAYILNVINFENVVGSSYTDTITGNDAANILYGGGDADSLSGGAGDDILIFDAADTTVEGGAGRDVGIVTGDAGVTVDLATQGLEVVVGGEGADDFTLNGQGDTLQMVAGGGGADTFTINVDDTSETVVVWGGEGADRFQINNSSGPLGIMTVNIEGLTEENFADFDLDMLGLGAGFNWGDIDVVVVNPDSSDRFYTGNDFTDDTTDPDSIISVSEGDVGIVVTDTNSDLSFIAYSQSMTLLDGSYENYAVGIFDASFLNTGTMSIQTSVEVITDVYFQPIDPDSGDPYPRDFSIYGPDDPDTPEYEGDPFPEWSDLRLGTADYTTRYSFGQTSDLDAIGDETNAFFWINYYSPNAPEWDDSAGPNPYGYASGVDTLSNVGTLSSPTGPWFVVGGGFDSQTLSSSGTITATMPNTEPTFSLTDWLASISGGTGSGGGNNAPSSTTNINSGSGTTTVPVFNTSNNYLIYDGNAVDPTDAAAGYTMTQVGANVEIDFGNGDVVTLENTSLTDWQTAAATQSFGSAGDDVLTGTAQGETFVSGAGNDVIDASSGDDTIVYTSGDDVITGHGTINYGNDTLDLSKYTADQVSFRIVGHDVFIDTPDGTIELDYQVRYDVGHSRSNIENIIFSDGTLDEAGIADRAIADQATSGDDVITGSYVSDTISSGAGNDVINASSGDDTIIYTSGNDVITGHGTINYGNDTLDLSKYTADQVSFRIVGHDVFIDTPDGTIELDYQVRYDVGHSRSNIENIIFSDGTLDEAGIADRAIADQATSGDDVITGSYVSDTISSGAGNDVIDASSGDDTIVYTSGNDVITGHGTINYGNDTLDLSKYTADQVSFRIDGFDVLIDTPDGTIELDYQVRYDVGHSRSNIENIIFSDGTLDEAGIASRAIADQATAGDDVITGSYVSDTISSGAGNDVINAASGDDTIVYTSGNDVITGHGTINYGNDTLDLSKYTADQVSFRIDGFDVLIDTPDGTIELDYQVRYDVGHGRSNIENIIFSDGTLDEAGIAGRAIADQATSGDDVITGSFQSETISGGTGNDILSGINGSDTFVFAVGDGVDHITDYNAANDTLEFTGISFADLTITQDGSDVVIEYGTSDQVIVENSVIANFNEPEFLFA